MSQQLIPVRMAIIKKKKKKTQITNVGKDVEKGEQWYTSGGNVRWCSHCGKQYRSISKSEKQDYHTTQQFHSWVYIWKKINK